MSDSVAERMARREAVAKTAKADPALLEQLSPGSVDETAANLRNAFTVPRLREYAEALSIDLAGARLKDAITEMIALELVNSAPIPEAQPEEEADAEASAPPTDGKVTEPVPAKASLGEDELTRPIEGGGKYIQIRHVTRTLVGFGQGDGQAFLDPHQARETLGKYLSAGYDLVAVEHLGIEANGHMILWGFGLPNDPKDAKGVSDIWHIVRTIGSGAEGAITGFQADAFISSYLADGYEVFKVKQLGLTPSGINMLWVLVR